jgi:hypothetical protein
MKLLLSLTVLLPILIGLSLSAGADSPATERKHLGQPTVIQGYPCAKDYAWFFTDGRLNRCTLSRAFAMGEARIPEGSIVELLEDGSLRYAMLKHPTVLSGVECTGGGPLGPGEGAMTALYASGKVKSCFLSKDETVQGVPCASGGIWKATVGHEWPIEFNENGKLKSCGLSQDYGGHKRGDNFVLGR